MRGQGGAWSLACGLWAPGDPQFQCSLPVVRGALPWATDQFPSYSWELVMEAESNIEVKEEVESLEVGRDSKVEETNASIKNSEQSNVQNTHSLSELCEIHGYELATSSGSLEKSNVNPTQCDYNLMLQPALSVCSNESESQIEPEKVVEASAAAQKDTAGDKEPFDVTTAGEPAKSSNYTSNFVELKAFELQDSNASRPVVVDNSPTCTGQGVGQESKPESLTVDSESIETSVNPEDVRVLSPSNGEAKCEKSKPSSENACGNSALGIEFKPQTFVDSLNSKLNLWKDFKVACPIKIEDNVQSSYLPWIKPDLQNSEEPSEWHNMDHSEKLTFISFRQAGVPWEEAIARINESRQKTGIPVLNASIPIPESRSKEPSSPKTPDLSPTQPTTPVGDKPLKVKLNLSDKEVRTFKKLRATGLTREEVLAKILQFRDQSGNGSGTTATSGSSAKYTNSELGQNSAKINRKFAKAKKRDRIKIFNGFNKVQKGLHLSLRRMGIPHEEAVEEVLEISKSRGIKNDTSTSHRFTLRGPKTRLSSGISNSLDVATSSTSQLPIRQQRSDVPENINDTVDDEFQFYESSWGRHRECKYSAIEIINMAKQIPEGKGSFARRLFILRCYKFGKDPASFDWDRYSDIPPAPKVFRVPPGRAVQKHSATRGQSSRAFCTHASCRYFSGDFPFDQQYGQCGNNNNNILGRNVPQLPHKHNEIDSSDMPPPTVKMTEPRLFQRCLEEPYAGSHSAVIQPVLEERDFDLSFGDTLHLYRNDPSNSLDPSGVPPAILGTSYLKKQNSYDEPRQIKKVDVEAAWAGLLPKPTSFRGNRGPDPSSTTDALHPFSSDYHCQPKMLTSAMPGPSHVKIRNSYGEPIHVKRRFVKESSTGSNPQPTLPSQSQGPPPSDDALRVCIVPNGYPSVHLDDEEMYEIESTILEAILDIDERMRPNFNGSFHNKGRYEVICQDEFSKSWLQKFVTCMSPNATLQIIPTSEVEVDASLFTNNLKETRSDEQNYPTFSGSGGLGAFKERSNRINPLPHSHPRSSKQILQDRLGPKMVSPVQEHVQYVESYMCNVPRRVICKPSITVQDRRVTCELIDDERSSEHNQHLNTKPSRLGPKVIRPEAFSQCVEPPRGFSRQVINQRSGAGSYSFDYRGRNESHGYVDSALHHSSSLPPNSQERYEVTESRSPSPEYCQYPYIETSHCDEPSHEMTTSYRSRTRYSSEDRSRSPRPDYRDYDDYAGYLAPSGDSRSADWYPVDSYPVTGSTRSPSPEYNHTRYIKPSQHDMDVASRMNQRPGYSDTRVASGYAHPSSGRYVVDIYPDSDTSRSPNPEYSRSRHVEQPQRDMDSPSRRSYSPDCTYTGTGTTSGYSEPSLRRETSSNDCNENRRVLDRTRRAHLRSPSPVYRGSRDHYYNHDRYRSRSPIESPASRYDARERLQQIRTNRDTRSAGSSYSSHDCHRERPLRSRSPCGRSVVKTVYSQYHQSRHSSKHY